MTITATAVSDYGCFRFPKKKTSNQMTDSPSANEAKEPQATTVDEFGRTIPQEKNKQEPDLIFPKKRPLIDAETELSYVKTLSLDNEKQANSIARLIVKLANPSSRPEKREIDEMANNLFTQFSKHSNILLDMFSQFIVRMSPQIEPLAALIGHYCGKFYQTHLKQLIQDEIPKALADAFHKDHFRVVKLLLRFLGAFVAYKLVTPNSFLALLQDLANLLENTSPCRGESLARAIVVACRTAPAPIKDDDIDPILQKVRDFIETRPDKFIRKFSPIKDNDSSFLDILCSCDSYRAFTDEYVSLFSDKDETKAFEVPHIDFTFGEVDNAPFPLVVLPYSDEVSSGSDPIIADIADDVLVFFGEDSNLTADQMFGLPMLINLPSLKLENDDSNSHFIIPIFNTIILSDLLRIPSSYYQPTFHISVISNLILMKNGSKIIETNLSPILLNIVADISSLDPGCYFRFVKFFTHYISLYKFSWAWEKWAAFSQLAENDMRLMFLRDVLSHCHFFGSPELLHKEIKDSFDSIMPPAPEVKNEYDDNERSQSLKDKLKNDSDNFKSEYQEICAIFGDFKAIGIFITSVLSFGEGDTTKTLQSINEFSNYITEIANEEWKKKAILLNTITFFSNMLPVLEEVIVYLILNNFIDVEIFIKHFFDSDSSDLIKTPESWELFHAVIDSIIGNFTSSNRNIAAQETLKEVFTTAEGFYKSMDRNEYDSVAEKFISGNLKDFGRKYYNIFQSVDDEMSALISDGNETFNDIIRTVSAFGSQ